MKKIGILPLSIALSALLYAEGVNLGTINVEESLDTQVIKDLYLEDIKSADIAEALFKELPSVNLIRRSQVANDITIRGQKKDNINVVIDGMKLFGGCPNRMDPPISHVLSNIIDRIEIIEGPFDVENFGVLSADVKVYTLDPVKGLNGDVSLSYGKWSYLKNEMHVRGGSDKVQFLIGASYEKAKQYEDGSGRDFVGQIQRAIDEGKAPASAQYQPKYQDMDAYSKGTFIGKLLLKPTKDQDIKFTYIYNRSEDILYPSSSMDALYDESELYKLEYTRRNLGAFSKELKVELYKTKVDHPMSTKYRMSALMMGEMTHALISEVRGVKVKNSFDIKNHTITYGVDYSIRNWDGKYYKNSQPLPEPRFHSIYDAYIKDWGFFIKDQYKVGKLTVEGGLRYDRAKSSSKRDDQQDNSYNQLTGYLYFTYNFDSTSKIFLGLGKSYRVPDPKELYWVSSKGVPIGNPSLKATKNYEIDLGFEKSFDRFTFKAKAFYSRLKDYIAYNASKSSYNYENVDAKLYGIELMGTYFFTDSFYADFGLSYQRGKKDEPLSGQSDRDLPDVPPLKFNLALNYQYDNTLNFKAEFIAAKRWTHIDSDNGEQEIPGYGVVNLKVTKKIGKNFEITAGVDNLFDKDYVVSNTYKDLKLLTTGGDNVMLMHEPGRNIYVNLRYRF
ncbi:MAG: TonB-dependent receptor [Epsilonproteobacteria bacterium]|nr:TonB-dependent receptor [Campylobacterota bacterium]